MTNNPPVDTTVQNQYNQLWKNEWRDLHKIGPSVRTRYRLLIKYFKKYISTGRVIDTGCGDGQFLSELHRQFADQLTYAGGDISDQAVKAVEQLGFVSKTFVFDVTQKNSLSGQTFSAVVSSEVLEHISDWRGALKNLADLTAPGGYIFITVPALRRHWGPHDDFARHVHRFEIGEIEAELIAQQFEIKESFCWGWPFYSLYYTLLLNPSQPETVMNRVNSPLKRAASVFLYYLFHLDDFFHTQRGRRLFVVAKKPMR